jgi:uncharacterized protein YlxP (DUF503 family)
MNVGACRITLRLPGTASLKDKRQIVKSITTRVRNKYNVSVAEIEDNDRWQIASLGICVVSNNSRHANEVLSKVVRFIEESRPDVEMLDYGLEVLHPL